MPSKNEKPTINESALRKEQSKYSRQISRRSFLAGFIVFAATYVAADQGLATFNWGERKTGVKMLPEHENLGSEDLWLVAPGLGVQSSFGIASTLRTSLEIAGPVAYMDISDEGMSINALARHTNVLCKKRGVKRLKLFGNSMGILTGIQVANQLDVGNVDIAICDGSPYDMQDVRDETLTNFVKTFVERYPPGYVSKYIGEAINSTIRDPNTNLDTLGQLKDAYRVTGSGVAPQVWADQLVLLGNIDTRTYQEKIKETVKSAYLLPDNPNNDKVVNVTQAHERYNETFYDNMTLLSLDMSQHASPTEFPGQYNQALSKYLTSITVQHNQPRLW